MPAVLVPIFQMVGRWIWQSILPRLVLKLVTAMALPFLVLFILILGYITAQVTAIVRMILAIPSVSAGISFYENLAAFIRAMAIAGQLVLPLVIAPPTPGAAAAPTFAEQLLNVQVVATDMAAKGCKDVSWYAGAGVADIEAKWGALAEQTSSAGAYGWAQFVEGTWRGYGSNTGTPGRPVPWKTSDPVEAKKPISERYDSTNFHYAIPAMFNYLCALTAQYGGNDPSPGTLQSLRLRYALFYYSHYATTPFDPNDPVYVVPVINLAAKYQAAAPAQPITPPGANSGPLGGHSWRLSFGFGERYDVCLSTGICTHRGIDMIIIGSPSSGPGMNGRGQPVKSFTNGIVAGLSGDVSKGQRPDPDGGRGIMIWDTQRGVYYRYFHWDQVNVVMNQPVTQDTVLGILGGSGTESFPHLHFEVSRGINGDLPVTSADDPCPFIGQPAGQCHTGFTIGGSPAAPAPAVTPTTPPGVGT